MAEYIEREAAYDMDTLYDWFISSVSENDNPVWTEEHLEELLNDFYVIPKDTPTVKAAPVRHGRWLKTDAYPHRVYCSECYATYVTNEEIIQGRGWQSMYCTEAEFCPHCGAKMDEQ